MHKVLITGASGFLGRCCLPSLAADAEELHVVVRPGTVLDDAGMRVHHADLLDPARVSALVAEIRPSHLLHLAWIATPGVYWTAPENLDWVGASLHLLRAFAEHGGRRVVMAGTCAEYDWTGGLCREAETPLKPTSLYGVCKNSLREVLDAFARQAGLSAAWGRVFFLYGPREQPQRLAAFVIRALLRGEPAPCSAGTQRRDFLHVQDAADAFVALLRSDVCGPVNVGSGTAPTVRAVVERLAGLVGRPDLLRLGALPAGAGAPPRVVADVARLRDEVRWTPRLSLDDGLAQTVEWWRLRIDECHRAA